MDKLKKQTAKLKIDGKPDNNQGCCSEQYPWFSFRGLTRNSRYNLENLSSGHDREITLLGLHAKLKELSSETWVYWQQQPKKTGLETLQYSDLNFDAGPKVNLTNDTTVYVFRFDTYKGNNDGRIIGFKESPCSVFYIIGFDLNYTAYNHGS